MNQTVVTRPQSSPLWPDMMHFVSRLKPPKHTFDMHPPNKEQNLNPELYTLAREVSKPAMRCVVKHNAAPSAASETSADSDRQKTAVVVATIVSALV